MVAPGIVGSERSRCWRSPSWTSCRGSSSWMSRRSSTCTGRTGSCTGRAAEPMPSGGGPSSWPPSIGSLTPAAGGLDRPQHDPARGRPARRRGQPPAGYRRSGDGRPHPHRGHTAAGRLAVRHPDREGPLRPASQLHRRLPGSGRSRGGPLGAGPRPGGASGGLRRRDQTVQGPRAPPRRDRRPRHRASGPLAACRRRIAGRRARRRRPPRAVRPGPERPPSLDQDPIEDVQLFLRAADVAILPYVQSLNSGVLLLALSFGVPVVVPSRTGFDELVDPTFARTFEPGDPAALAAAIRESEALDPRAARAAALSSARRFDPDQLSVQFADGLRDRLRAAGGAGYRSLIRDGRRLSRTIRR